MFVIRMAGLLIGLENRYPFVERQCRAYTVLEGVPAFTVSVTPEEITEEQKNGDFSAGYCESICLYRHICEQLPAYNIFLMHSAVIEVDGRAYAFTAPSGTGKSTHISLWLKNIPHARVINGDKPLYKIEEDGKLTVFGTPWNGKENWGENLSAPLAAVCFLERGKENSIRPAEEGEVVNRLVHQLYLRGSRDSVNCQLLLMDALVRTAKFYVLACNISDEAAWLSYRTMSGENQ